MKATTSLILLPLLVAAGACSSGSSQNNAGGTGTHGTADAGNAGDDASGDDGGSGASTTSYAAVLSGANVVPAVQSKATGTAKLTLEADGQTLDYDITQNVAGATGVNLHIGAPLESGNVTHQLTPVSQHMKGKVTLTSDEQSAIGAAQLYIDVLSQANPGGEIRGQVTSPGATIYVAVPTGAQEVPAVTSSYQAHASFVVSSDGTQAIYHVVTNATPTNVLVERAIASINGQVIYPLTPVGQTLDGTLTLGSSDQADFQASHFYVNIQTAQNATGELRGQVIPPGATLYSGVLSGANEVPPVSTQATGGAQLVLGADQKTASYELVVSGVIPTSAQLNQGNKGKVGPTLYQLTLDQSGAQGTLMLDASDLPMMAGGSTYVNVDTASYPNGELRAQLVQE